MIVKMNQKEYNDFINQAKEIDFDVKWDGNNQFVSRIYSYLDELWLIEFCNGSPFNNYMITERRNVIKKTRNITETYYD